MSKLELPLDSARSDRRLLIRPWVFVHLGSILLFSLGSSIITPYFAIYVAKTLGYGLAFAGLLVSVKVVAQRATSLLGGMLTDMWGARPLAVAGVVLRLLAFTLLLKTPTHTTLLASALLNGVGAAIYHPALRKLLFEQFRNFPSALARVVGLRNVSLNLGAAVGPLLGALLVDSHFTLACEVIVAVYAVNVGLLMFFRRSEVPSGLGNQSFRWTDLRSGAFLNALWLQFGLFAAYSHFEFLMPFYFEQRFGSPFVAGAFLVNTVVVVLIQLTCSKRIAETPAWVGYASFIGFFVCCAISSLGDGAFWQTRPAASMMLIGFSMTLFTVGEVLLGNRIDLMTTRNVPSRSTGTAFGAVAMIGALAVVLSNGLNTYLMELKGFLIVWLVNAIVGLIFLVYSFRRDRFDD